jgi:hypothetical protein
MGGRAGDAGGPAVSPRADLVRSTPSVVSVGLDRFDAAVAAAGAAVTHVSWRPPAGADPAVADAVAQLVGHPAVEAANTVAFGRYLAADPVLVGVGRAGSLVPALGPGERRLLHAGPPIAWDEMCGPMQGAVVGAVLAEGWAADPVAARSLVDARGVALEPCHHHGCAGPMAGVVAPSMPMWVVEEAGSGRRTHTTLNEGLGKVLRFGAIGPEVLDRLAWMAAELGPVLTDAVGRIGGLRLKPLMAQALHMGDECHNRNAAATGLLLKQLVPALLAGDTERGALARVVSFLAGNDHTFLNVSMAACKSMLDAAAGVAGSSMVTTMARNGVRFGIRLSGTGERWFEAPANRVEGLYFPGYGPDDAAADLGDSAITETAGLGAFAMAAAPAIVQFVGGSAADAVAHSRRMRTITLGANDAFTLPALGFAPTAAGIDARAVVDTGVVPVINTGIAHRDAGVGQIGAGITTAPAACFTAAVVALATMLA